MILRFMFVSSRALDLADMVAACKFDAQVVAFQFELIDKRNKRK